MELEPNKIIKENLKCDDPVYYRNAIRDLLIAASENNLKIELEDKFLSISNNIGSYGDIANERVVINLNDYIKR